MRRLPAMEAIWRRGIYTGPTRPMARLTVQRPKVALRTFGLMSTFSYISTPPPSGVQTTTGSILNGVIDPTHGRKVSNTYADILFSNTGVPKEIPNIKSVNWTRSLDSDAAQLTVELYNTKPRDIDDPIPMAGRVVPESRRDLDHPGWYTPTRGTSANSKRWGHTKNDWYGMLLPDNIIRTYEGYGFDPSVAPEKDPNLVQTGVWMIDSIRMNALGTITVNARDLARLLLDQQSSEPVIPKDFDPLRFSDWQTDVVSNPARSRVPLQISDHSNRYGPFKQPDGTYSDTNPSPDLYRGHRPTDVLDDNPATWWMSFSHIKPNWRWGVEWIEVKCKPTTIDQIGIWLIGHGYTMYTSVYSDGAWLGPDLKPATASTPRVPWQYNPESPPYPNYRDQQARIPYTFSGPLNADWARRLQFIVSPKPLPKVTKVRFSFRNLQHIPGVTPNKNSFRVAVRQIYINAAPYSTTTKLTPGPAGSNPGRYSDYTDIVKLACAWAGLFWPATAYHRNSDATTTPIRFKRNDDGVLGAVNGRVWGDFEQTGTTGFVPIDDPLVNKSLMDVVTYIRNIIGYAFFIDEHGAAQWRLPNCYDLGNWVANNDRTVGRTSRILNIDEKQILVSLDSTLNSRNVFEYIRVSNLNPDVKEGVASTYNPNPIGLRRVGLWNEDRFKDTELQRTADMTAAAALWLYRTDRAVIPGFPGIQIDDQVRLWERVTSEGNIHYVKAIQSSNDLETGEWTYTLDTQWLGDNPRTKWAIPTPPAYVLQQVTRRHVRPGFGPKAVTRASR